MYARQRSRNPNPNAVAAKHNDETDNLSQQQQSDVQSRSFEELFDSSRGDMIFGLSRSITPYLGCWALASRRADYLAVLLHPQDGYDMVKHIQNLHTAGQDAFFIFADCWPAFENDRDNVESNIDDLTKADFEPYASLLFKKENRAYATMIQRQQGWLRSGKNLPLITRYTDYLRTHERYSFFRTALSYGKNSFSKSDEIINFTAQKFISRGSKAALDMLLNSRGKERVHFILDGIDIERVIAKQGTFSITASELRFLYRNRAKIKNRVYFYRDSEEVLPPWESDPGKWRSYEAKHSDG
ncbi:TPA: hypothetical protein QH957_004218 [Enterobacter bugandensis]|nr:hypothetical protein [Enterobacter bugandensis]